MITATASRSKAPLLELRGLSCRFGGLVALDRVSFGVQEGEIFGLIGPKRAWPNGYVQSIAAHPNGPP